MNTCTQLSVSINAGYAAVYLSSLSPSASSSTLNAYKINFSKKRATNNLSQASKKRLRNSIQWLAKTSTEKSVFVEELDRRVKFKLSFITLTLPSKQIHTDKEIKRECLNVFLQWLRDTYKDIKYVWKAEIQQNGNIHFHITTDVFIHYRILRARWNKIVNKLGYVDRYFIESGSRTPPSTEVKAVKKVRNIAAYLVSYLADGHKKGKKVASKEYHKRVIDGKLYGCSKYLMGLKNLVVQEGERLFDTLMRYLIGNSKKIVKLEFVTVYSLCSTMFKEIIETYTEINGFDWLANSGFNLDDIGYLSG